MMYVCIMYFIIRRIIIYMYNIIIIMSRCDVYRVCVWRLLFTLLQRSKDIDDIILDYYYKIIHTADIATINLKSSSIISM
jgi:hypothetical protein